MKKFKTYLAAGWILCLLIGNLTPVKADQIQIHARLDTQEILIGDQIHYTFEVTQTPSYKAHFPSLRKGLHNEISVLDSTSLDTVQKDDNTLTIQKKYLITTFDSGYYKIPSYPLVFQKDGKKDTLQFPAKELWVYTLKTDTAKDIQAIKPPLEAPVTFAEILPYLGYGLLGIAIIGLIIYIIRKRRKKQPVYKPVSAPSKPAYVIALEQLDQLKAEKLWQQNRIKEYYTRLTNIIRAYLERRYGIKAMEETTSEILKDMEHTGFSNKELFEKLRGLLGLADLVKFAKNLPEPDENEKNLENAYDFVIQTKQKDQEEEQQSGPEHKEHDTPSGDAIDSGNPQQKNDTGNE